MVKHHPTEVCPQLVPTQAHQTQTNIQDDFSPKEEGRPIHAWQGCVLSVVANVFTPPLPTHIPELAWLSDSQLGLSSSSTPTTPYPPSKALQVRAMELLEVTLLHI